MIQNEFRAVEDGPEDVAERTPAVLLRAAALDVRHQFRQLFGPRLAAQAREVKRLDLAGRVQERSVRDGRQRLALVQAGHVRDDRVVHHRQHLGDRRRRLGLALDPVELGQEIVPRRLKENVRPRRATGSL